MKYLLSLILLCCLQTSFALTNITSPNVSGQWTLAGSPYIVQVNINVPTAASLKIDPGVEVKFYAGTKFNVFGKLIAKGTAAQNIIFRANDTTGWSLQNTTAGGWNGLHFMQYQGGGIDSSAMEYCTIRDCKYGYNNVVNDINPFLTYRKLKLSYCTFTHNTSGQGMYTAGVVILLNTMSAADTIEMDNCIVSDNSSVFGIVRIVNYSGGFTRIQRTHIYDNKDASPIWGSWVNTVIENNEIDHNEMINDASPIKISIGTAAIRSNKVHHNKCEQLAAIGCRSGKIDINNNLICNNEQLDGNCGATGGGGGIHLAHNEGGANFQDTYYRVRNNVIANNFTAYGGGGIYVYHAIADIMNNTIVNNRAATGMGNGVLILDPASEVKLKNNLFKGNNNQGWQDTNSIVYMFSCNKLLYDYNFIPANYSLSVTGTPTQLIGDTSHNVLGMNPMLVAPTANNLVTTDATAANFNIQALSPCIDKGDTVGASPLAYDYVGGTRIMGPKIDIGAYEVFKNPEGLFETATQNSLFSFYPNPSRDIVHITTPFSAGRIELCNIQGSVLKTYTLNYPSTSISIATLPKGVYLLRVANTTQTSSERLVVE
jgi:hypothetical protein